MEPIDIGVTYTWRQARGRGARRRQLEADGRRLSRGLYLSSAVEPTLVERCRAWSSILPAETAIGLRTTAELWGAPVLPASTIEVVLPPRRVLPQRRGLTVHVRRDLRDEDVVDHQRLRVTSPAQTFLDLAARLPPAELVALGDWLLRGRRLTPDELDRRLSRADGIRGVVRARRCAPLLSPLAMSRPESLFRYWLLDSDLPRPEVQVPVLDRWGRPVTHADLGYPAWKVALEYEGRQHAERDQFGRDIDRYSLMAADGWLTLRFAARHLGGPTTVVDRTRRALMSRGWR